MFKSESSSSNRTMEHEHKSTAEESPAKRRRQASSGPGDDHPQQHTDGTPPEAALQNLSDPQHSKDLMSRLSAFLPQMKAANQNLANNTTSRLDVDLHSEKSSSDDDCSNDDDSDEEEQLRPTKNPRIQEVKNAAAADKADNETSDDGKPAAAKSESEEHETAMQEPSQTIQLSFALGDMTGNPLMELLGAEDSKHESDSQHSANASEDEGKTSGRKAAERLLQTTMDKSMSNKGSKSVVHGEKSSLITEL